MKLFSASKNIGLYSLGIKAVNIPPAQQLLLNSPKELSAAHMECRSVSLQSGPSISIDGLTFSQAVKAQFSETNPMRLKVHKLRYWA